jgi:hypothetical protein
LVPDAVLAGDAAGRDDMYRRFTARRKRLLQDFSDTMTVVEA